MRPVLFVLLITALWCACKTSTPPTTPSQPGGASVSPAGTPAPSTQLSPAPAVSSTRPKIDACALLSTEEIEAVQGERVKETKLSGQATGGYSISQCFYSLPTFTNSISLMVAHKGEGPGAKHPKEFWRETFHEEESEERRNKREEEEEKESAPPERIRGVGNEAYWMGNKISGALYVLKGDSYLRISIGGPVDAASKKRAKTLASKAIARL